MEENNFKKNASSEGNSAENRGSHSLSSSDSLIQTQRKLKQEYAVRLSQQNIDPKKLKQNSKFDVDCTTTPELIKQYASEDDPDKRQRIGKGSKMNPFDPCDPLEQETSKKGQNMTAREGSSAGNNNFLDNKSGLK